MENLTEKQKRQREIADNVISSAFGIAKLFECNTKNESKQRSNKRILKYS